MGVVAPPAKAIVAIEQAAAQSLAAITYASIRPHTLPEGCPLPLSGRSS